MNEKHVNFFALQKVCDKKGCPICNIVNERITRYIDGMLFEHISDRTFRRQYKEAGGFCSNHSKTLLSYRDGLAVAILGQGELQEKVEDFKKKKMSVYKAPCPACAEQDSIEKDFLLFITESKKLEKSDEQELIDLLLNSEGLCVHHYSKMVSLFGKKIPKWFSEFQEKKFGALLERTENFIQFSAWGRQAEFAALSPEDKVVWKELAQTLRGDF